jgi:uncharacterized Zn-finger protein
MVELTLQIKQEETRKSNVKNSNIENIFLVDSEAKAFIIEENFEENKCSDDNFIDIRETKKEIFELDIKSEYEFEKDPLYVSENSERKYHEIQKTFKCSTSDASFASNFHLTQHIESVHEGEKPFKCQICDAGFSQKSNLKTHILSVHDKEKHYKCHICDANFA